MLVLQSTLDSDHEEQLPLLLQYRMDSADTEALTRVQQYDSTDTAAAKKNRMYSNVPLDERDIEDPTLEEGNHDTRSVPTLFVWTRSKYFCLGVAIAVALFISSASLANVPSSNNSTHVNATGATVSLVPMEDTSITKQDVSDTTAGQWQHKPSATPVDSSSSSSTKTNNDNNSNSYGEGVQIPSLDNLSNEKDTLASILPGGSNLGYIQYPHVYNNTLVFCSEGNLYLTTISQHNDASTLILHAMKLTQVIGNVLTPKINPKYPYWIAYTATYSGRREAYLMDLRPHHRSQPSTRLTYLDSVHGALHIIGWEQGGTALVIGAYSMDVSLDDYRLYTIKLQYPEAPLHTNDNTRNVYSTWASSVSVSKILPIPLSQAIDSVVVESDENDTPTCRYFTRFSQSSNTIRYVGGTVESLWAYCDDQPVAIPLTADYNGTSKSPHIYSWKNGDTPMNFLLFLSDRSWVHEKWIPTTMNLWAMPLPTYKELYPDTHRILDSSMMKPFPLTSISCQFNGLHLREFSIDDATGNVILRIGADLHLMTQRDLELKLSSFTQSGMEATASTSTFSKPEPLPIVIYSDFHNLHERVIPLSNPRDVSTVDIFTSNVGTAATLMTARGQLFVNPIRSDISNAIPYSGGGMNMPSRRYRVSPGSMTEGIVRILGAWSIPIPEQDQEKVSPKALILATDPLSTTAEMAFYITNITAGSPVTFAQMDDMPRPFIGGHLNGGSVADGGLGSIYVHTVVVSPCGRRAAWTDTDGRIVVMTLSLIENSLAKDEDVFVLPQQNENHEPVVGIEARLTWSPAGRYLAIEHNARNQFQIISIADLGDPSSGTIHLSRIAQATPDRFNSFSAYWGRAAVDFQVESIKKTLFNMGGDLPPVATTLYFISDRDVILDGGSSPWGSRAPGPVIADLNMIYALPLVSKDDEMTVDPIEELYGGNYVGGGGSELLIQHLQSWEEALLQKNRKQKRAQTKAIRELQDDFLFNSTAGNGEQKGNDMNPVQMAKYATDTPISFGPVADLSFARRAFSISQIPLSRYILLFQLQDNPSLIVAEIDGLLNIPLISLCQFSSFPDTYVKKIPIFSSEIFVQDIGLSTDRKYIHVTYSGRSKVFQNTVSGVVEDFVNDLDHFTRNIVDTDSWAIRVWPKFEYLQIFSDSWRMLRDYYYDPKMTGINWLEIHSRYLNLVKRCARREELDDVLKQMSSELSALHVFVYGGEYPDPFIGNDFVRAQDEVASLAAALERSSECSGYIVTNIGEFDPDFNPVDGTSVYSPLSDRTLGMTGQRGLAIGDVIVGINGENVLSVPDIFMLLRGQAGRTVRLDVVRVKSKSTFALSDSRVVAPNNTTCINQSPEPVLVVPISSEAAANVRYLAWEWKTRQQAKSLAAKAGFTVGYIHLRSMIGAEGEDSFIRGFYPDFDKDGMIIDVRHNVGGNIDSWLLTALQKKAWMYWQDRARNITTGGMGWDEQFAFRGHLVVLVDEKTSSDGEGFARGVSELRLGKLVGTRTWGGGIWLSSDNKLVDGGIVSAPEVGTYNEKFGWGLGIEQAGVRPDIIVDNDPRETFDGKDRQLEEAINILHTWLLEEPIAFPRSPGEHHAMTLDKIAEGCSA